MFLEGAIRRKKHFKKALIQQIYNYDYKFTQAFKEVYHNSVNRITSRMASCYLLLNKIAHSSNYEMNSDINDMFFLYYESINLLFASCKNLQFGSLFSSMATQRQALEVSSVAFVISIDNEKHKEFSNNDNKFKSSKCITYASRYISQLGKIYGYLSNQAVHINRSYIGSSIVDYIDSENSNLSIGTCLNPYNADKIQDSFHDLLEIACIVNALIEYSLRNHNVCTEFWRVEDSNLLYCPSGKAKDDLDYIYFERRKREDLKIRINVDLNEQDKEEFDKVFNNCKLSDVYDISILKSKIKEYPNSYIVQYFLGECYYKKGDIRKSITLYVRSGIKNRFFPSVKRLIELYRDSQDFEILNELYKLALSINNNHGPTLNDYGKFLNDNQYHDDAIRYLKKSLALDNKNSIRLYNYALSLIGKDEIKKSMSIYNKIIKISPYYVSAWHSKGVAHLRLNQIDKAYNCFRKAVLIDNGYVASWLNLGAICFYKKNINKALLIYNYCVKIVPESYEANKMMTETYYYMGLKDKCIYYAQITQSIDKNDQRIKEILSNLVNDI